MEKFRSLLLILFLIWMLNLPCFAEDIYVTGVTKITMRTGPGTEHKIVAMLKSGTKLEIMEYQKDWSQVKTETGDTGYVLSRFLTDKVPDALMVDQLKSSNEELKEKLKVLESENAELTERNATLLVIEGKYNTLKQESADFLKLDAKYTEMTKQFEAQKARIIILEEESQTEIKFWVLIGAGVFIVGLIFGLSTRKKRKSSLL
jgi:SH3 domain protein